LHHSCERLAAGAGHITIVICRRNDPCLPDGPPPPAQGFLSVRPGPRGVSRASPPVDAPATVGRPSAGAAYFSVIFTPSAANLKSRPCVVETILITTLFWFCIAVAPAPPPTVAWAVAAA